MCLKKKKFHSNSVIYHSRFSQLSGNHRIIEWFVSCLKADSDGHKI